ncbi:MAG TPA: heavy metal translocating P-type ATPase, partial [Candidatus Thermoplasmatota archaeon]|nr:heavy metal translocating P-type ATPase [Candidatus Thermoplasmatota archaeon]
MPVDPVCGALVREGPEAVQSTLGGHTYLFCSRGCLRRFTAPERELAWLKRSAVFALAAGGFLLALPLLGVVREPQLGLVLFALGTAVQVFAGWPFYQGIRAALRAGAPNMDTLIAVGTTAAWLFGTLEFLQPEMLVQGKQVYYFEVSALVLGFVAIGRSLEQRLRGQASQEVRKLLELQPTRARILRDGQELEVGAEQIVPDMVVVVRAGERVPVDGVVIDGASAVDEKFLTGESLPVDKRLGDKVIGGSINRGSTLHVKAIQVGGATALSRIVALIADARTSTPTFRRSADRLSAWFVPAVIVLASFAFLGWFFVAGAALPYAFSVFVAVLLIACPAALGLAAPSALAIGVSKGASEGMLIKDAEVLERIQGAKVVVFDKTGTITRGEPDLTDIIALQGTEKDLLRHAASAEENTEHPLGKTILRAAREQRIKLVAPDRLRPMTGVGIEAEVDGHEILVGNARLLRERRVDTAGAEEQLRALQDQGKTVVLVARDGELAGLLAFADPIKPEAAEAVKSLQARGIEVCIVTGDNARTAQAVARKLNVRRSFAEITPHGKAAVVKGLQEPGRVVAMVGDGVNDAPALARADVGIAIGAGTDVAIESAGVVLAASDPRGVIGVIRLSRASFRKMAQNLAWGAGYNLVAIPLAAGVLEFKGITLSPAVG